MTAAKATETFCRYCAAHPGQFCDSASPCEANSHQSRWADAQQRRIEALENALADAVGWSPNPFPPEVKAEWRRLCGIQGGDGK